MKRSGIKGDGPGGSHSTEMGNPDVFLSTLSTEFVVEGDQNITHIFCVQKIMISCVIYHYEKIPAYYVHCSAMHSVYFLVRLASI